MDETLDEAVRAAFGPESADAMSVLMSYGTERWHREPDRVRRDIVTLSEGNLDRLRYWTETAKTDYRDVLLFAEYPRDPDEPKTPAEVRARIGQPPDPDDPNTYERRSAHPKPDTGLDDPPSSASVFGPLRPRRR